MKIDVASLVPKKTSKGHEIVTIKNGKNITILYKSNYGRNKQLKIKRFVELNDLFFEGFGLIEGDGDKAKFIGFTNSEFSILRHFLEFMEKCFGFSRDLFSVRLLLPVGTNPEEAKNEVKKELNLKDHIIRFGFRKNHKSLVVNLYNRKETIDVVFRILYQLSRRMANENKSYAIPYLRGVTAAEGTVQRRNTTKSLFAVKISSTDIENTRLYKNLLRLCDIEFGKDERDCIPIRHLMNFLKMNKCNLMKISERKKEKFKEGLDVLEMKKKMLLDHGVTKGRIIRILNSYGSMTAPELLVKLRKTRETQDRPTLYRHLYELEKKNEIKKVGIKTIRRPYHQINIWSIANPSK